MCVLLCECFCVCVCVRPCVVCLSVCVCVCLFVVCVRARASVRGLCVLDHDSHLFTPALHLLTPALRLQACPTRALHLLYTCFIYACFAPCPRDCLLLEEPPPDRELHLLCTCPHPHYTGLYQSSNPPYTCFTPALRLLYTYLHLLYTNR